jgi:3-oxoacyl-(acyl-carrier-protein) synthase
LNDSSEMTGQISIVAAAVDSPLGDLDGVWAKWSAGDGAIVLNGPFVDDWVARTERVVRAVLPEVRDVGGAGLVLATTKGDVEREVLYLRSGGEMPTLGGEASRLARTAGVGGAVHAVSTACSSGLAAMIDAAIAVLQEDAKEMIVVAGDESTSFVHDGFRALRATSVRGCRPFDQSRDGLMLGAAAGAVVLRAAEEGDSVVISGFGVSNDASHMTAPDPTGAGLVRAIEGALTLAGLPPENIDVVFAHATGTRYNDAMETTAIRQVFLQNGGKRPAVTAVKSLIGHTLGAAGLVESALAVKILEQQVVPGIIGLELPEFEGIDFVRSRREIPVRHVLKMASGFGGMNAAVILSLRGGS